MRAMRALRSTQVSPVRFHAELVTGLQLARGVGPASYTRNTSATVFDWENRLRTVAANEARFSGARRVQNLLAYSEDFSNSAWGKLGGGVLGSKDAEGFFSLTAPAGTRVDVFQEEIGFANGDTSAFAIDIKNIDATSTVFLLVQEFNGGTYLAQTQKSINRSTTNQRFVLTRQLTNASTDRVRVSLRIESDGGGGTIKFRYPQLEDITGQANKAPGEYVSTNVLSFPFHGAGVDGVQYFDTTNGNSVDANGIVTEAPGLPLAPWIYGRFGKSFITYDPWLASTVYVNSQGAIPVRQNGYYYIASSGTSGATEPNWPTTIGATVVDGTITWTCKGYYKLFGYLAEGQRTNSILQCRNFADAAWTNSATAVTATQNATGIDGVANTAWTLSVTDGVNQFKTQAVTVANDGNVHTATWFIPKSATANYPGIGFTLTGGTTTLQAQYTFNSLSGIATARTGNATGAQITVELIGDYWWVQIICANNTTGNVTLTYGIYPCVATSDSGTWAAALTGNCVFDWAQLEYDLTPRAYAASHPILTTTTAVTRSADVLKYPEPGNINPTAGTAFVEYRMVHSPATFRYILNSTTGDQPIIYLRGDDSIAFYDSTNVTKASRLISSTNDFRMQRAIASFSGSSAKVYLNKDAPGSGTFDGSIAYGADLFIGSRGSSDLHLFGNVRNVKILNRALLDAEISEL